MPFSIARIISSSEPRTGASVADPLANLAQTAARGDARAMRTLLVSVGPAVLRVVRSLMGTNPEHEDVMQEAALAFARALPAFRNGCTVTHFACSVAINVAISARRKARVRSVVHAKFVDADGEPSEVASPARQAADARRREILCMLCEELPDAQATTLAMFGIAGFTIEEIAAAEGAPLNTIRSRLRLAKKALRERIGSDITLRDELGADE